MKKCDEAKESFVRPWHQRSQNLLCLSREKPLNIKQNDDSVNSKYLGRLLFFLLLECIEKLRFFFKFGCIEKFLVEEAGSLGMEL